MNQPYLRTSACRHEIPRLLARSLPTGPAYTELSKLVRGLVGAVDGTGALAQRVRDSLGVTIHYQPETWPVDAGAFCGAPERGLTGSAHPDDVSCKACLSLIVEREF
jgi:hypothetical protein